MYRSLVVSSQLLLYLSLAGCGHHHWLKHHWHHGDRTGQTISNPLRVATTDSEFLWNQIVDTLDNYFKIEREERVRVIGGVLTTGRIDTYPVVGATLLEPWRGDSGNLKERLHATLQSVRRRGVVHVVPVEGGFDVEVIVLKELEDVSRPEDPASGIPPSRAVSSSTVRDQPENGPPLAPGDLPFTKNWIPLGRDPVLEQRILVRIQARVAEFQPVGL
jgi:hypothetical protein